VRSRRNHDISISLRHFEEPKSGCTNSGVSKSGTGTLPSTEHKADWDDYRQESGLGAATGVFNESMYQTEGKSVIAQLKATEGH